jgi:hypothetical protein
MNNIMNTIIYCPYPDCNIGIEIIEVNCAIFRCGICKDTGRAFQLMERLVHVII